MRFNDIYLMNYLGQRTQPPDDLQSSQAPLLSLMDQPTQAVPNTTPLKMYGALWALGACPTHTEHCGGGCVCCTHMYAGNT